MIKAVLIDHMGTLVYEQSEYLEKLMSECVKNCPDCDSQTITKYWFTKHDELLKKYNGENYKTEYQIACEAFECTKAELGLLGDSQHYTDMLAEHWKNTPAFDDAYDFFAKCQLPIYILTNNDTPAKEAFEKALEIIGLDAQEVIYIGDSLGKDILAAQEVGIQPYFIGKEHVDDENIKVLETLLDIFQYI